jgi:multisubunit Na+/H+ antiporter MnhB subunit
VDPYSPGARLVAILFRTAHLFTMAVFVGGVWLGAPGADLGPWRTMAIGTGLLLLATEVNHDRRNWLWQACGLAVVAHVAALGLLAVSGRAATALAVVIGAAGSHAPKWLRKWSLRGTGEKRGR